MPDRPRVDSTAWDRGADRLRRETSERVSVCMCVLLQMHVVSLLS